MSRVKAPRIEVGRLVVDVEWRNTGYDRGIAIVIGVRARMAIMPVAKLDAFETRPHWHQSLPDAHDEIVSMDTADPMAATYELLESLPDLLLAAGHPDVAGLLTETEIDLIVERVRKAVDYVVG